MKKKMKLGQGTWEGSKAGVGGRRDGFAADLDLIKLKFFNNYKNKYNAFIVNMLCQRKH
jgi:hypothetical protein